MINKTPSGTENPNTVDDRDQIAGSVRSAIVVVPRILNLFPWVRSVIDVGCGTGDWLQSFSLNGVPKIVGLDGKGPTKDSLPIDKMEFRITDLSKPFPQADHFDLALSLEVAAYLPPESAVGFVTSLTKLSDVVVFSAAIPGQGGIGHVNERWPGYWVTLFKDQGFTCFDILRGEFWYDERVEWQYAQNMLVFVKEGRTDLVKDLQDKTHNAKLPLDLVHPRCFAVYRSIAGSVNAGQSAQITENTPPDETDSAPANHPPRWFRCTIRTLKQRLDPPTSFRKFLRKIARFFWRPGRV